MATTATALSDKQLESELARLKKELGQLEERLQAENRKLDAANSERNRVAAEIERGVTGRESDWTRAKEAAEIAEIRCDGVRKLIPPVKSAIQEIGAELNRRQEAAANAAFGKEFAELQEKGAAIASRILEQLKKLISEDLAEFDAIRVKLETRFASLGGQNAAFALRRLLFDARRVPMEAHIAALLQEGWEVRGPALSGPLELAIRSMTHTAEQTHRDKMAMTVR
jgi:predicted  nucleic acid-binding Zn-ribbon protein